MIRNRAGSALRSIPRNASPCQPTATATTAAPVSVTGHQVVGTPTSTSAVPAASKPSRTTCCRAPASVAGARSTVWAKWKLHTRIAWLAAPSRTRCSISQSASGTQRWITESTIAATNQSTSGRSRQIDVPRARNRVIRAPPG